MSSGAAFRTSVTVFKHIRVSFAAQSRRSSGNCFLSAASFLKTCTVYTAQIWIHRCTQTHCHACTHTDVYIHKGEVALFPSCFLT